MLTIAPSSGPSGMPALGARIGGIGRRARGVGVDREAGARALACRIGDARQRLFQTVADGRHVITGSADDVVARATCGA